MANDEELNRPPVKGPDLEQSFRDSAARHELFLLDLDDGEPEPPGVDANARAQLRDWHGNDIEAIATSLIAAQSAARTAEDLRHVLANAPESIRDSEEAQALLLALFLVGRATADGGAQMRVGPCVFGDHLEGLENVVIEAAASLGDFPVDFLVTYSELGANPAHRDDPSAPASKLETQRIAFVREARGTDLGQRILRRTALSHSFENVIVVSYDDAEIRRDPFAIAHRALREASLKTQDRLLRHLV
jgi:hypothetical protein